MIPAEIILPSGRRIDPLRIRVTEIEPDDIALGLATSLVVSNGIRLPISLAQLSVARLELFTAMMADRNVSPSLDDQLYLLLKDAWQYPFAETRIELRSIYDQEILHQISVIRHRFQSKMSERFEVSAPGKNPFLSIADRLARLEMEIQHGGRALDTISGPDNQDAMMYHERAAGMQIYTEQLSITDARIQFLRTLVNLLDARKRLAVA